MSTRKLSLILLVTWIGLWAIGNAPSAVWGANDNSPDSVDLDDVSAVAGWGRANQ